MIEQQSQLTTDHETIRTWARARNGIPTVIKNNDADDSVHIIRINFPDYSCEVDLKEVSWEVFFHIFESTNLAFVYQEKTRQGEKSHYHNFVKRDSPSIDFLRNPNA